MAEDVSIMHFAQDCVAAPIRLDGSSDHCELPMRIPVLASILAFAVGHAHADVAQDALADILKCAEISDAPKRLECFDATTARAKAALATQPAKDKGTTAETFGLPKSQPVVRTEDFGRPPRSRDPRRSPRSRQP